VKKEKPQRPLAPLREADDRLVTGVITACFVIALAVVLILTATGTLPRDQRWWTWTCVTGVAMGLFGLWYVPVLTRTRARTAQRRAQKRGSAGPDAQASDSGYESLDKGSKTVSSTETPGRSTRS
jgi:integral membrane sensor domain MASE1